MHSLENADDQFCLLVEDHLEEFPLGSVVVVQHGMAYSGPCRDGHHLGVAVALLHKLLFRRLEDFRGRV